MDVNDILEQELYRIQSCAAWYGMNTEERENAILEAKDEAARDVDMTPWVYILAEIVEG